MDLIEILKKKSRVITAELGPPKGTDLTHFFKQAAYLKGVVDAANVTEQQSALMKLGSLAACFKLQEYGIPAIMQMTCRDKNAIALQAEVLQAAVLGGYTIFLARLWLEAIHVVNELNTSITANQLFTVHENGELSIVPFDHLHFEMEVTSQRCCHPGGMPTGRSIPAAANGHAHRAPRE